MHTFSYQKYPLGKRKKMFSIAQEKHPNKILVVCECDLNINDETIYRFALTGDMKFAEFFMNIRKRISVNKIEGLYGLCNNKLICGSQILSKIYNENKNEDGFLYILICKENTFG